MNNNNQSIYIKKEVMARLIEAYLSDDFPENTRLIPYDVRPTGAEVPYRCCIYKERAILKTRIIANLGFPLEDDDERVNLTTYAKQEEARMEIRKKAAQYLLEFEEKRQEQIAKKRKELEEKELNQNQQNNTNGTSDSWSKVSGNIDLKDSEYKGSKDVQRMREAMLNKQNAPNTEPLQNFFG